MSRTSLGAARLALCLVTATLSGCADRASPRIDASTVASMDALLDADGALSVYFDARDALTKEHLMSRLNTVGRASYRLSCQHWGGWFLVSPSVARGVALVLMRDRRAFDVHYAFDGEDLDPHADVSVPWLPVPAAGAGDVPSDLHERVLQARKALYDQIGARADATSQLHYRYRRVLSRAGAPYEGLEIRLRGASIDNWHSHGFVVSWTPAVDPDVPHVHPAR